MRVFVDLHIHSCLSPCADNEMTPNNIVNMACIKGLDVIAVTDHNCARNCQAVLACAHKRNILAIPGMEIETREEVHLVCLFPGIQPVLAMQEIVSNALPEVKNREDIFGQQIVMDESDVVTGREERLLVTATGLGVEEVFHAVHRLGGVVIPAHVDRDSYSILSNLGVVPEGLGIRYLEISKSCDIEEYRQNHPELHPFHFIQSSDAHQLGGLLERETFLDVEGLDIASVLQALKQPK